MAGHLSLKANPMRLNASTAGASKYCKSNANAKK